LLTGILSSAQVTASIVKVSERVRPYFPRLPCSLREMLSLYLLQEKKAPSARTGSHLIRLFTVCKTNLLRQGYTAVFSSWSYKSE
jgi:hypothetical protein